MYQAFHEAVATRRVVHNQRALLTPVMKRWFAERARGVRQSMSMPTLRGDERRALELLGRGNTGTTNMWEKNGA